MTVSKAHIKASAKYNKANYAEIKVYVKKEEKETIKAIATSQGMSVNAFITTAIDYYLQHTKESTSGKCSETCTSEGKPEL